MSKVLIKTILFIIAWLLSFFCGIYLTSILFMGMAVSTLDTIMTVCGFILSMLWFWFNTIRV